MKNIAKKIAGILEKLFGYAVLISVFTGGLTFFAYLAALIIGGENAALICEFVYKTLFPVLIKISTISVLAGLVIMYLRGETSLTINTSKKH